MGAPNTRYEEKKSSVRPSQNEDWYSSVYSVNEVGIQINARITQMQRRGFSAITKRRV